MFYDYMFYIVFDFMMAVIMFLFGMWFYKSEGKAAKFLSGYNMKSADERKKYDENAMCKAYGKRMMFMSVPFIIGIIIDIQYQGIGCWIAWGIWLIMFVLLLIDRHKRERKIPIYWEVAENEKSRFVCEKPVNKRMLICIACGNGSIEYRIELSKTRRQRLC